MGKKENFSSEHAGYMRRALDLAGIGRGHVSPNPMVGCVIVYEGKIIGEGWHKKYGQAHAEVEAVDSVKGSIPRGAEMYVNLEPCSHYGQTPPCADLVAKLPLKKLWVCNTDPNPKVAGRGLKKIRAAGTEVETGLMEEEGEELNKRFFTFHRKQRPYIILKWAETGDRFIAREDYTSKWISNAESRLLVHKWRSEEDAILVGRNTIEHDNPRLNVRDWTGPDPVRIVLDKWLRIDKKKAVFDGSQKTLIYNVEKESTESLNQFIKVKEDTFYDSLVDDLFRRNITSLFVEGGEKVYNFFLQHGLWDELRIFQAPGVLFGAGVKAPQRAGKLVEQHDVSGDLLFIYRNY